jgi:hypothetical protein
LNYKSFLASFADESLRIFSPHSDITSLIPFSQVYILQNGGEFHQKEILSDHFQQKEIKE